MRLNHPTQADGLQAGNPQTHLRHQQAPVHKRKSTTALSTAQVRYEKQHQDTTRAAALRSKMEEEYRCALKSSSQERARLESWVESLERELLDARHLHALRYTEVQ